MWLKAVAVIFALTALFFGVRATISTFNKWEASIEQRGYDKAKAEWTAAALKSEQAEREKERQRNLKQQEDDRVHKVEVDRFKKDAANSANAVASLRNQLAATASPGPTCADSLTPTGSPSAATLGNILGDSAEAYQKLAEQADDNWSRGRFCEARYEAVRVTQ